MGLKTGDLDLQGQIGLEIFIFCVIPCECDNFWTIWMLASNLYSLWII